MKRSLLILLAFLLFSVLVYLYKTSPSEIDQAVKEDKNDREDEDHKENKQHKQDKGFKEVKEVKKVKEMKDLNQDLVLMFYVKLTKSENMYLDLPSLRRGFKTS